MIYDDRIQDLIRLGYTPREATFLVLVCRVSGYFTRSQFNTFLHRKAGGMVQQLVDRAIENHHVRILEGIRNWHIYHVTAPLLYQRVDGTDSTNRRLKGDEEIRRRLLILESCVRRTDAEVLVSSGEKAEFFGGLGVPPTAIPWAQSSSKQGKPEKASDSCRRLPVLVRRRAESDPSITFLFADPGFATMKPFVRYLEMLTPLLSILGSVELVYACESESVIGSAQAAFEKSVARAFPGNSPALFPHGVDHFLNFLEAERRWATSAPDLSTNDVHVLNEGEACYTAKLHSELRQANTKTPDILLRKFAEVGVALKSRFTFVAECFELPRTLKQRRSEPKQKVSQVDLPIGA